MKRRTWFWFIGLVLAAAIIPTSVWKYRAYRDNAELEEQLRLARAEGLPTNAAEFAATVPTALPSENAASLYRQVRSRGMGETPGRIDNEITFRPTAENIAEAQARLERFRVALTLIDRAVLLKTCWFDRDWAKGPAVLLPEYAEMHWAGLVVSFRGSLSATKGDPASAIADIRNVFQIARHAGQEPQPYARAANEYIYLIGLRHLANWAFVHREQSAYREALKSATDGFPRPNLRDEHSQDLYFTLQLFDEILTAEGRKQIGLGEPGSKLPGDWLQVFSSKDKARAGIVRAEHAYWDALIDRSGDRSRLLASARRDLRAAMKDFPLARDTYESLFGDDNTAIEREASSEAVRLEFVALLRALQSKSTPTSIKTTDLISPFDGKPLTYRFDGRQIVIGVSGYVEDGNPILLKVPPGQVFEKAQETP